MRDTRRRFAACGLTVLALIGAGVTLANPARGSPIAGQEAVAGPGWTNVTARPAPVPMAGAMMAYSPRADRFVLFGGWDGVRGLNGTWVFDPENRTWTELHPQSGPLPRGDEMFVYDPRSDLFVLFGGWYEFPNDTYERLSDTWTFSLETATWTERYPSASPSPRSDAAVAYDPAADAVLLVGGFSGTTYLGDVWAYFPANDTWVPRPSALTPSVRADGRMVYAAGQDRFYLFGGNDFSGSNLSFHHLNDTWSYDWASNAWTRIQSTSTPAARDYAILAFVPQAGELLLTSGFGNHTILNDLWAFDLTHGTWSNLTSSISPPPRFAAAGGFDPATGDLVVFSGAGNAGLMADTWFYHVETATGPSPALLLPLVAVSGVVIAGVAVASRAFVHRRRRMRIEPDRQTAEAPSSRER